MIMIYDSLLKDLALACKRIIDYGKEHNIPVNICGEMASNKDFLKLVYGYGHRRISISPSMINQVYKALN